MRAKQRLFPHVLHFPGEASRRSSHFWALLAVVIASPLVFLILRGPGPMDRVEFYKAVVQIPEGATKSQVRSFLGPPDQVISGDDLYAKVGLGQESWCYGTHGDFTLPTLGRLDFKDDVVAFNPARYGPPPQPLSIIGDEELVRHLKNLDPVWSPYYSEENPAYLLRMANDLWPLGETKAVAVIKEWIRLGGAGYSGFWLLHLLFEPLDPPGYFEVPGIGSTSPSPPKDMRKWPDYPLISEDSIPFSAFEGITLIFGSVEH